MVVKTFRCNKVGSGSSVEDPKRPEIYDLKVNGLLNYISFSVVEERDEDFDVKVVFESMEDAALALSLGLEEV